MIRCSFSLPTCTSRLLHLNQTLLDTSVRRLSFRRNSLFFFSIHQVIQCAMRNIQLQCTGGQTGQRGGELVSLRRERSPKPKRERSHRRATDSPCMREQPINFFSFLGSYFLAHRFFSRSSQSQEEETGGEVLSRRPLPLPAFSF